MLEFPPDIAAYVQAQIADGKFRSGEEFAIEAVRLYREIEQRQQQLKADIQIALDDIAQNGTVPFDIEAMTAELIDELDELGQPKTR